MNLSPSDGALGVRAIAVDGQSPNDVEDEKAVMSEVRFISRVSRIPLINVICNLSGRAYFVGRCEEQTSQALWSLDRVGFDQREGWLYEGLSKFPIQRNTDSSLFASAICFSYRWQEGG